MVEPLVLLWGTISFTAALVVHIIIWRIFQPNRQMMWLVVIFIILPGLLYIALFIIFYLGALPHRCFLASPFNLFFTLIWHCALSSAYIMTYSPIQAGCPSLKIMLSIAATMPEGMTFKDIEQIFSEDTLFSDRIEDLEEDGLITLKYNAWGMTFTGRLLSEFFLAYRKLLKLPLGEG